MDKNSIVAITAVNPILVDTGPPIARLTTNRPIMTSRITMIDVLIFPPSSQDFMYSSSSVKRERIMLITVMTIIKSPNAMIIYITT